MTRLILIALGLAMPIVAGCETHYHDDDGGSQDRVVERETVIVPEKETVVVPAEPDRVEKKTEVHVNP
jgi:hypothetical protein